PSLEEISIKLQNELKNLVLCKKAEDVLDDSLLSLDTTLIKSAIENARQYQSLKTKINYAYKVISSNEEKNNLISLKLDEALQEGDRKQIMKVINSAKGFPNLENKV